MLTAYVVAAVLAAAANIYFAIGDFRRLDWVIDNLDRMGVPRSWRFPLGVLKTIGAIGLLVGIGVPLIGVIAAVGLVLFFVGAIITHIRARAEALTYAFPGTLLLLALASLVPRLASW
jgi:ABC-type cobalamin transport system permease subunit